MDTERHPGEAPSPSWARGWMSDSAQLLFSQALTVLATSVAAIMIARTLDPHDWGVFSAFLGLSLGLALLVDFGMSTWLIRELSRMFAGGDDDYRSKHVGGIVSSALVVNCALALPLVGAAAIWSVIARPGSAVSFALLSLLMYGAFTVGATALEAHLRARRKIRLVLTASLVEKAVLIVLLVSTVLADGGLGAIGLSYLAAGFARIAVDGFVLFTRHRVPFVIPTARGVVGVARASFPFAFNAASFNLFPRLDTLVLITMSTTSAAWFAIGDRVLGPALLFPATLSGALYPFMSAPAAKHAPPWKLAGALGIVGAVLAGLGMLLAPLLIPLLFGKAYEEAVPVAQVMLVVLPLVYAASPLLVIAYSHGAERSLLAPILAISLIGTVGIVIGQATGGATLAAAGYVARSALFLVVVGLVALMAWRRHTAGGYIADPPSPRRVSQSP